MWFFLGCCVIAATILYVGKKITQNLFAIAVLLEMFGSNSFTEWVPQESFDRAFKDYKEEYSK